MHAIKVADKSSHAISWLGTDEHRRGDAFCWAFQHKWVYKCWLSPGVKQHILVAVLKHKLKNHQEVTVDGASLLKQ